MNSTYSLFLKNFRKVLKTFMKMILLLPIPIMLFDFFFNLAMLRKKILVFVQKIELEFSEGVGMG